MSADRGPELDQLIVARLVSAARRHTPGLQPTAAEAVAAIRELREIAGGRDDLLAEVAGLLIGYYRRSAEEPKARAAANYCVAAGADRELIPRWIEVGRRRADAARQVPRAGPEADPGNTERPRGGLPDARAPEGAEQPRGGGREPLARAPDQRADQASGSARHRRRGNPGGSIRIRSEMD